MASNAELLAQIAQLAGAINKHKIHSAGHPVGRPYQPPYSTTYRPPAPTYSSAKTYHPNGLPLKQTAAKYPVLSANKKLVLNGGNKTQPLSSSSHPSVLTATTSPTPTPPPITPASIPQPPKMTTGSHHKTLILNGKQPVRNPISVTGKRIYIKGVPFVADQSGRKLIREGVDLSPSTPVREPSTSTIFTPKRLQVEGVEYVRTKSGNLVRIELVRKRLLEIAEKRKSASTLAALRRDKNKNLVLGQSLVHSVSSSAAPRRSARSTTGNLVLRKGTTTLTLSRGGTYSRRTRRGGLSIVRSGTMNGTGIAITKKRTVYCQFYCRFGKCKRGPACPYIHDPARRFLCRRFLQGTCPLTTETCPLSHAPTPHTMATCQHFQHGACKRVNCPFPHVRVNRSAPVCRAFALQGYCGLGLECRKRHVWCCPDFADTGKCPNVRCRLPHVGSKGQDKATVVAHSSKRKSSDVDVEVELASEKRRKVDGEEDDDGFLRFDNFIDDDWKKAFGAAEDADEELMIVPDFTTDVTSQEDSEDSEEDDEVECVEEEAGDDIDDLEDHEEAEDDGDESDLESVESDALDEESQRGEELAEEEDHFPVDTD
ncbi:hypothetical protein BC938DRAFT_476952 [Jimgerdemannia flammicorona]|uniref:C3H1-type domain-containing protein n=1 Tax=Jimgerdemannia flammicorona TaxID=994334 RepID=A0A433QQ09_9FUNG|nr:hypothetical protein BC938DRAFT_476952 [Jimgerdemannia flammicorona]